ncbi:MAG: hypothetical protein IT359_18105 [Gemmatimonadaceae bacterium]|nr:hypothetical protein [Gemmatimonadaceae bacterium]
MKRFALAAAVLFVAACGAKEEATPAADSAAAPAMAPAPAPATDSAATVDTAKHDSAAADTTKH